MAIFMKFEGIDGHVEEVNHEKWFEVEAVQWSVSRNVSLRGGGGQTREATQPSVSEVIVTKTMDTSSPRLFAQACGKAQGKKVELHVTKSSGANVCEFVLANTIVAGYSYSHSGSQMPMEAITLNFTNIQFKTIPYGKDNKAMAPVSASYDLAEARAG